MDAIESYDGFFFWEKLWENQNKKYWDIYDQNFKKQFESVKALFHLSKTY